MNKKALWKILQNDLNDSEQLNRETLARWQEAEQGKVVSDQAVSKWLDTWGTDKKKRPPCGE